MARPLASASVGPHGGRKPEGGAVPLALMVAGAAVLGGVPHGNACLEHDVGEYLA